MTADAKHPAGGRVGKAPIVVLAVLVMVVLGGIGYILYSRQPPAPSPAAAPSAPPDAAAPVERPAAAPIIEELRGAAAQARARQEAPSIEDAAALPPPTSPLDPEEIARRGIAEAAAREEVRRAEARLAAYLAALEGPVTAYETARMAELLAGPPPPGIPGAPAAPQGPLHEVAPGTVIRGTLVGDINSEAPGTVLGQVSDPVHDSATGRVLVIPAGSRLAGSYAGVAVGASRIQVRWNYLVHPDGRSVPLAEPLTAADAAGAAGLPGAVDRHLDRGLTNALLLSVVSAGVQLSQPRPVAGQAYDAGAVGAAAAGQQLGALGTEYARQGLNLAPTVTVERGAPFTVVVAAPLLLPAAAEGVGG